jgi:multiple sugar transport system substrate-binding protein
MAEKPLKRLSRRDMLRLSGTLVGGALLAGCAPATEAPVEQPTEKPAEPTAAAATEAPVTEAPVAKPVSGHVVVMHHLGEFTEDHVAAFQEANPDITLEVVDGMDPTRFFAMYAAGSPPDLYRLQAPSIPGLLARKLLLDLTPFFEASQLIDIADLAPANDYYKAESPLEIGTGKIYGMTKDFSPDCTVFANKVHFEKAGLPAPDDTKAMTYTEIMDAAKQLTTFDGERMVQYGYGYETGWIDRFWMNILAETGASLYAAGYEKMNLTESEDAKAIVKWFYDLAVEKVSPSPKNPSPAGWFGTDFVGATASMAQYGFWFSAMAVGDANKDAVVMLPGPTWAGERRDPTVTATGAIITSATQVPDAAWKVFEFYHAGEPSVERAASGWGVPALKSQWSLIPQGTDFQKQAYKVLQDELALNTPPLQFNPFIGETVVSNAWSLYLDQALSGTITFDDMLAGIEKDTNTAIKEGIDRIMP